MKIKGQLRPGPRVTLRSQRAMQMRAKHQKDVAWLNTAMHFWKMGRETRQGEIAMNPPCAPCCLLPSNIRSGFESCWEDGYLGRPAPTLEGVA